MNDREIAELLAYSRVLWPHTPVPDVDQAMVVDAWRRLVGDLPAGMATAAMDALAGREYAPTPGQLRAATVELLHPELTAPSAEDAWREVCEQIGSVGMTVTVGPHRPLRWTHPAVARTVAALGWRELCLSDNVVADRAHFMRLYAEGVERDRRALTAPPSVLALHNDALPAGVELDPGDQRVEID